ncbi:alkyl hydroperoxide reductase subunit C, partial [Shigella flexneri 1235-66]
AWHSSSETIAKIKYAMIGDPTGALTRNFDNMREDEGLADRATLLLTAGYHPGNRSYR